MFRVLLITALVAISASDADAGWFRNRREARQQQSCCGAPPPAACSTCQTAEVACCGNQLDTRTVEPIPAPPRQMPVNPPSAPLPVTPVPLPRN